MPTSRPFKQKHPAMWLRYAILGGLLIYVSYIGYMHLQHQTEFPPVDAICPFGGLESLYALVFHGNYLQRIFISSFILLGVTLLLVLVSGRSFCGWICPLGTLQGIAAGAGKRLGFRQRLSLKQDRMIRWLRYPVLVVFTVGAWIGGKLLIRPYDPWVAWMHIWEPAEAFNEFPIGFAVLAAVILVAVAIPRPFCRYLCPMGIFLGITNRISLARITVDQSKCIHCMACDRKCPVGIPVESSSVVSQTECLSCGECIPVCPVPNTMKFEVSRRRISPLALAFTVILVFFGVIGLTKAVGIYQSTPPHVEELKASGDATPDDIKGYMSLTDIAVLFDLDRDSLYARLGFDPAIVPPDTKCRDIAALLSDDVDTDSVRRVVAEMIDAPPPTPGCDDAATTNDNLPTILGTHTLRQVAEDNELPLHELYAELGLDSALISPDTPCRELKNLVDSTLHTSRVREAVARLKNRQ